MTLRLCSMRTGLAASTVTPGSTAPEVSLTTPVNVLCACAIDGSASSAKQQRNPSRADVLSCHSESFQLKDGSQGPAQTRLPILGSDDELRRIRHESEWSIAQEVRRLHKNNDKSRCVSSE